MNRVVEFIASLILILVLSPVLLVVSLAVRLVHGSPVIFRQERPGLGGESFEIWKFRTMSTKTDSAGTLLPDNERITRLGAMLRSTSLDEIPELFNVMRGEMSLVGPRPLLPRYLPHFTESEMSRFKVKPGITGWAQINGRNNATWDERLAMDVWYVERRSLRLDLIILARTAIQITKRSGVVIDPTSTMLDLDAERRDNGA